MILEGVRVTHNKDQLMDFSLALRAMKSGQIVARLAWKNPGKFVCTMSCQFVDPDESKPEELVTMKRFLVWRNDAGEYVPWVPSQDAILAEDWFIGKSGDFSA